MTQLYPNEPKSNLATRDSGQNAGNARPLDLPTPLSLRTEDSEQPNYSATSKELPESS